MHACVRVHVHESTGREREPEREREEGERGTDEGYGKKKAESSGEVSIVRTRTAFSRSVVAAATSEDLLEEREEGAGPLLRIVTLLLLFVGCEREGHAPAERRKDDG